MISLPLEISNELDEIKEESMNFSIKDLYEKIIEEITFTNMIIKFFFFFFLHVLLD